MKLPDAMELLVRELTDELVVTNISSVARFLYGARDRDRNLYSIIMGLASSVGLGLALALPEKKVLALDGDGSLLMNLGSLATIANEAPANFILVIFDNECYEGGGEHPSFTGAKADLRAMGQGAGIKNSVLVRDLGDFEREIKKALKANELTFLVAKVERAVEPRPPIGVLRMEQTYRFLRSLRDEGLIPPWFE